MTFLRRHSKPIALILLVFLGVFLIARPADAIVGQVIGWIGNNVIAQAAGIVLGLISTFLAQLLDPLAKLLDWTLGLTKFTKIPAVEIGWGIVRDTVNMFFVIILLVIAFATIFGVESYGLKRALPRLIMAALLVNFSLIIAGVIVDLANVMTHFFLSQAGGGTKISESIAQGMKILNIFQPTDPESFLKDVGNDLSVGFSAFAGAVFSVIFLLAAIFVFLAMIFMFLGRIVWIWFLLILAPAAWLLWILPMTEGLWKKWWSTFLKYAFFAPVAAFFIYLALLTVGQFAGTQELAEATRAAQRQGVAASEEQSLAAFLTSKEGELSKHSNLWTQAGSPNAIFQIIIMTMLLLGGLLAASSIGAWGASTAMGLAGKGGKGIANWTGRRARWLATKAGTQSFVQKGGLAGAASRIAARIPVVRGPAVKGIQRLEAAEKARVGAAEKRFEGLASKAIQDGFASYTWPEKVAAMKVLAKRKDLKEGGTLSAKALRNGALRAAKYDETGEILRARPDLLKDEKIARATKRGQEGKYAGDPIGDQLSRMTSAQMKEIHGAALEDSAVAEKLLELSPRHWAQLLSESNRKNVDSIAKGLNNLQEGLGDDLNALIGHVRQAKPDGPGNTVLGNWMRRNLAPGLTIVRGEAGERGEERGEERGGERGGGRGASPYREEPMRES
ncbi:hypothetical protein HYV98_00795 [Candidatus Azambacteria bacterium]|nr:hypothetical protein [Candidatus Azambacteria bacterium]